MKTLAKSKRQLHNMKNLFKTTHLTNVTSLKKSTNNICKYILRKTIIIISKINLTLTGKNRNHLE